VVGAGAAFPNPWVKTIIALVAGAVLGFVSEMLAGAISKRTGKDADAVREGWIGMTPEGRLGRPEELAAAVAFLASPDAGFIRGVVLPVDGGRLQSI
jgi:3-oxoacyl-[acyl-carrier protein] reductase